MAMNVVVRPIYNRCSFPDCDQDARHELRIRGKLESLACNEHLQVIEENLRKYGGTP